MTKKYTFDDVKSVFKEAGRELISTEYIPKNKLKYRCHCGKIVEVRLDKFKNAKQQQCRPCAMKESGMKKRTYNVGKLEQIFAETGAVLLETEYLGYHIKHRYICSCGNEAKITPAHFISGERCEKCAGSRSAAKLRGRKRNKNLTQDDREKTRKYPEYIEWRKSIYERDHYCCVVCGTSRDLNAHHINSYSLYPAVRLHMLNGVTMCKECHKAYHRYTEFSPATICGWLEFLRMVDDIRSEKIMKRL